MSFSRKWWGEAFIDALEKLSDQSRLARGRTYARNGKIISYSNVKNIINAQVEGSINPYFNTYKKPLYKVKIEVKPISKAQWAPVLKTIGDQAYYLSHLLLKQVPNDIEHAFIPHGAYLLPQSEHDFRLIDCSCPDYAVPCKHIAGVYYLMAKKIDEDPFLLFELRGLGREDLLNQLKKTKLGSILADKLSDQKTHVLRTSKLLYPHVEPLGESISEARFFYGGELPGPPARGEKLIPAVLIKKQGDYPGFWESRSSFISWMESVYARVDRIINRT